LPGISRKEPRQRLPQQLHHGSAKAAQHHRPECRFLHGSDEHLDPGRNHALDEKAGKALAEPRFEIPTRHLDLRRIAQPEHDATHLRLVQERRPNRLHRDRKSEIARHASGLLPGGHHRRGHQRHTARSQHLVRFGHGQPTAAATERLMQHRAHPDEIDTLGLR
jgi:hypothetical protein